MANSSSNKIEIDVTIWLNGGKSENSFAYHIKDLMILTYKILKENISIYILNNKLHRVLRKSSHSNNLEIKKIYTNKEIELNDLDIQYIKNGDLLFITFDNSNFYPSNHFYQYKFVKCIKEGGYGKVFVVNHIPTQKEYAIKLIDISLFSTEELFNISREQIILQSLQNINVIKWHDSFTYQNNFFTVMDYAKGGELSGLLKEKGRLSETEAKSIFKQIQHSVNYIHNKNIIHRDLKPNNILFLDEERTQVVLIDFGISGFYNGSSKEIVHAGTTHYMAPEMASGKNFQSAPALDLWSMGIILYKMITGKLPFNGKNEAQINHNIVNSPVYFDPELNISNECKELILGLLQKNTNQRIDINSPLFEKWYCNNTCYNKINLINSNEHSNNNINNNELNNNNINNNEQNNNNNINVKQCKSLTTFKKINHIKFKNNPSLLKHNNIYSNTNMNNNQGNSLNNDSNFNAYLSPHNHNIRQHINDYLNSVEQESNKKQYKNYIQKKSQILHPVQNFSVGLIKDNIKLPLIKQTQSFNKNSYKKSENSIKLNCGRISLKNKKINMPFYKISRNSLTSTRFNVNRPKNNTQFKSSFINKYMNNTLNERLNNKSNLNNTNEVVIINKSLELLNK